MIWGLVINNMILIEFLEIEKIFWDSWDYHGVQIIYNSITMSKKKKNWCGKVVFVTYVNYVAILKSWWQYGLSVKITYVIFQSPIKIYIWLEEKLCIEII